MNTQNGHTDKFIRELFRHNDTEKAPEGFADNVMQAIESNAQLEGESSAVSRQWWLWISIGLGFVGLIVAVFIVDFTFMADIFSGIVLDKTLLNKITEEIGRELLGIQEGFQISSLTLIIGIAIVSLFAADRIFRRKPKAELHIL